MSIRVKICGFRDLASVNAAVAAGVDAVGFVFAESLRRITPEAAVRISTTLPPHVARVAVMLHPSNDQWQHVLRVFRPEVLQTDAEDFASLEVPDGVERWPVHREGGRLPATRDTYIYEGPTSGRGETVDWTRSADIAKTGRMILAGGLSAANIAEAIAVVHPYGVDVSSGVESAPGCKNARLMSEFVSAVKAAEINL